MFLREEGNALFKDALNRFCLRLYDVGHMVKDNSYSESGNPLPPLHGLLFFDYQQCFFYITSSHKHNSTYHDPCYISRGALCGTRNNSKGSIRRSSLREQTLNPRSYISFTVMVQERKEVFYLTTHSTHLVTVIWLRTYDKGPFT